MQLLLQEPDLQERLLEKVLELFEQACRGGADVEELLQELVGHRLVGDLQDLVGLVGGLLADEELGGAGLQDLHQPRVVLDVVIPELVDELK